MADPSGLSSDERILWEGRPDTKLRFGMETMATGIFAVALVLACLGIATVVNRATPGLFWVIFGPGLLLGIAIVMVFPLLDTLKRGRTTYQITSKRIIITRGRGQRSYALPTAENIILRGETPATITFGRERNNRPISLERIADAAKVHTILQDLATTEAPT